MQAQYEIAWQTNTHNVKEFDIQLLKIQMSYFSQLKDSVRKWVLQRAKHWVKWIEQNYTPGENSFGWK